MVDVFSVLEFWASLGSVGVLIYSLLCHEVPWEKGRWQCANVKEQSPPLGWVVIHSSVMWMCFPHGKWPRVVLLFRHFDIIILGNILYSEVVFSQMMQ